MDPRGCCLRTSCIGAVLAVAACSPTVAGGGSGTGDDAPADSTGVPIGTGTSSGTTTTTMTGPGSDPTAGPPTTGTTSSATGDDVDAPIEFDVAGIPDAPGIADGCNAVDFLFVIDSSGSMFDKQVNLVANFPTFSAQIQETLENVTS